MNNINKSKANLLANNKGSPKDVSIALIGTPGVGKSGMSFKLKLYFQIFMFLF